LAADNARPLILSEKSKSNTHAGNCLHRELSPLAPRPTGKENTEENVVIFAKLMSIVEEGPCQVILEIERRNGGVDPNREGVNTEVRGRFVTIPCQKLDCGLNSKYSINKRA
jgi:hypothetical protein